MGEEKKSKPRRIRGEGSVFQKKGWANSGGGRTADYTTWTIQYYKDNPATGKRMRVREGGFPTVTKAREALTERLSKVDRGEVFEPSKKQAKKIADLYAALKDQTETESHNEGKRGKKRVQTLELRWDHLKIDFGFMLAKDLTTPSILKYTRKRQKEGAADATINRELATLRRMYNYGHKECTPALVHSVPYFPMLTENNARQGFVEDADFDRLVAGAEHLWLRTFLEMAYTYGWRRGELINLRVGQVSLPNRTIRLETGTTKNGEGRQVAMTARVEALLREAVSGKAPTDSVFTRDGNRPVIDFQATWEGLCVRAGLGSWTLECNRCDGEMVEKRCECGGERLRRYRGLMVHDFRRSAAKALRRAGVPESVIMATGGWKTPSMFRRYAIVSSADQRDAVEALERARDRNRAENARPLSEPEQPLFVNKAGEGRVQ